MFVGILEIVVILLALGIVAWRESRTRRVWPWGIPAMLAVTALCTPPDVASQILIGGGCSVIYFIAQIQTERRLAARPEHVPEDQQA